MNIAAIELLSNGDEGSPVEDLSLRATEQQSASYAMEKRCLRVLDEYKPHGLNDLRNASLMNRVDSKFIVPQTLLADLLSTMKDHYTALEIDEKRCFRYLNTYFDNNEYSHYLAHHNGKLNRHKIRQRTYLDSSTSYLEVKFKNNKRRTLKSRVRLAPDHAALPSANAELLKDSGITDYDSLNPVQTGSYLRIALANEAQGERITIDCNLQFYAADEDRRFAVGPWVLVEVKQERLDRNSPFFAWARRHGLRKCSFSKYCMGVYFTGPAALKRNNFHRIARRLKLQQASRPDRNNGICDTQDARI